MTNYKIKKQVYSNRLNVNFNFTHPSPRSWSTTCLGGVVFNSAHCHANSSARFMLPTFQLADFLSIFSEKRESIFCFFFEEKCWRFFHFRLLMQQICIYPQQATYTEPNKKCVKQWQLVHRLFWFATIFFRIAIQLYGGQIFQLCRCNFQLYRKSDKETS